MLLFVCEIFVAIIEANLIEGKIGEHSMEPRFNSSCDALEKAFECEKDLKTTLMECKDKCDDELCLIQCQREFFIKLDGEFKCS